MYLRPDEVARVLEKVGFTVDVVTQKAYGYRRGENYVYVNREARMGRTALVIHPTLKERSSTLAEPASDIKTCDHYHNIRKPERYLLRKEESGFYLLVTADFKQSAAIIEEVAINRPHQHRNNDV